MLLRTLRWSLLITALGLVAAFLIGGLEVALLVGILTILEISLSFDNAVVNARVLERMNPFWQRMFLTVVILIAVFGMRLVFPMLIVGLTAHLGPSLVLSLALNPESTHGGLTYAEHLTAAHPAIAAFGGMFLFLIFLDFVFEERELKWLLPLEKALSKIGKVDQLSVVVGLTTLVVANQILVPAEEHVTVLFAGILGLVTYLLVNGLGELFQAEGDEAEEASGTNVVGAAGKAAFFLFLYLEVLDASFSFDGVIGAFAITADPIIISLGLGFVGAMFVRSITVFLVRKGTLSDYVYLEHGAHWAIGALAVILMVSIGVHINEIITGLVGVFLIGAAFISSLIRNKRIANEDPKLDENTPATV